MRVMTVELAHVAYGDKAVLRRLIEFYDYDFSEILGWDVNEHEHGTFGYRYFDQYWTDHDRHPLFIRVNGRLAGFALVSAGDPHDMAELFIMRKYRRAGVGTEAAQAIFKRFPGASRGSERRCHQLLAARYPRVLRRGPLGERSGSAFHHPLTQARSHRGVRARYAARAHRIRHRGA
jgi:Acetyltransferase (GNAT) family